ncbi:hypothetical protein [Paenibacillus faecalis]|uniref:hypothetical protein n=1 Tax=Paenibacillus faecalis TaxID=2079532 RepID=UPI000D0E957F|nr:hypothetical protein [Paenibacillus faecalis]
MKNSRLLQFVRNNAVRDVDIERAAVKSPDDQSTPSVVWHRLLKGNKAGTQPWHDRLNEYRYNK